MLKSQSDITAKLNGTFTPRKPVEKRKVEEKEKKTCQKTIRKTKRIQKRTRYSTV